MLLEVKSIDGGVVSLALSQAVSMSGRAAKSDPFRETLGENAYSQKLVIDMTGTDMIDSSGLGWLVACQKRCVDNGGQMVLHSIPNIVQNVLKIVKLDRVLSLAGNKREAEALVQGAAS
jgi:anti-anti-sigma factor